MMRIGICDDDKEQRIYFRQLCQEYINDTGIACELLEFASGEDILV